MILVFLKNFLQTAQNYYYVSVCLEVSLIDVVVSIFKYLCLGFNYKEVYCIIFLKIIVKR